VGLSDVLDCLREGIHVATNRPEPGDFLELAQRMLRDLFGESQSDEEPWAEATRRLREPFTATRGSREPSPERQRENLTFALATRAVEALEDVALNVAAIRQRLERTEARPTAPPPEDEGPEPA